MVRPVLLPEEQAMLVRGTKDREPLWQTHPNCDGAGETDVTSCSSVAKAVSTAMSTWGAASTRQAARAARSNIQAGISSHRADARPERLQRKTSPPAFSTTS